MGCLLYAVLWLANRPDAWPYDWRLFCVVLSLDSQLWFRWWLSRRIR